MLKTAATNARYLLSPNISISPSVIGSHRPLHGASAMPASAHVVEHNPAVVTDPRRPPRPLKSQSGKIRSDEEGAQSSAPSARREKGRWESDRKDEKILKPEIKQHRFENPTAAETALRPAVQAMRVKELGEKGRVEAAIDLVYTAPAHTLNIITWNTLLSVLMKAKRRKRAYEVYIEMKRRGFHPAIGTYVTMLNGMNKIDQADWPKQLDNLERCHKLYAAYEEYARACIDKNIKWEFPPLSVPRNLYIQILGKNGNFEKIVDIFYGADETGPLARNEVMYAVLFGSLLGRKETRKLVGLNIRQQNAADAKFFWRTLEKDLERGMAVDSVMVRAFIKLMANGRPADQQFGLEIVRNFYGLAAPGEQAPAPRVVLESYSLHAILDLCNRASKPRLCVYFMRQIMDQQQTKSANVPDVKIGSRHINQLLISLDQLAAVGSSDESTRAVETIRFLLRSAALGRVGSSPDGWAEDTTLQPDTVALAFNVCRRCGDWEGAGEIFTLVTQLPAEDFLDDGPVARQSKDYNIPERRVLNLTGSAHLARTALSTGDKSKMRQLLRMMSTYGISSDPSEMFRNFYKIELAKTTVALANAVSEDWPEGERNVAKELKRKSQQVLGRRIMIERPPHEDEGLGSEKYLNKLQQAIDFELATR